MRRTLAGPTQKSTQALISWLQREEEPQEEIHQKYDEERTCQQGSKTILGFPQSFLRPGLRVLMHMAVRAAGHCVVATGRAVFIGSRTGTHVIEQMVR